jgi:NADPH:quinone reductase-like Zn-dependent oxidoreductase
MPLLDSADVKAIVHMRFGPPSEVLQLLEVDDPQPGADEVLVRVGAAAAAKGDWLIARGEPYIARPSYGLRTPRQRVAGLEVAGTVERVGSGVERFVAGDEVFGWCQGAFAELVAVDSGQLTNKPANISFVEAAAVPISGFAALQAVRDHGEVRTGQQVLVTGASGGVGSLTVQIAKSFGAEVTGVASTKNLELLRSLGAEHVVDYTHEEVTGTGRVYDVIIDIAGNRSLSQLRRVLAPAGTLVIVGGTGSSATMGFGRTVAAMARSPFVGQRLVPLFSKPNLADLETLRDMLEAGSVTAVVGETNPLSDTPAVVEQLGGGSSRGKRVIDLVA